MLKSDLVISEELLLLDSHLKHYSIRFITPIFSDEKSSSMDGYKKERTKMLAMSANAHHAELRSQLIPQMIEDRDLFIKVRELITKNEGWDVDPSVKANIYNQMGVVREIIEQCCITDKLTAKLLNDYYEESLVLLIYFTAFRAYIAATRGIRDKFISDNAACVLRFTHAEGTSLSIIQQKEIINFVEKVLTCFFADILDIIAVELDTGSPQMDCSIRLNLEAKVTWDITKLFSDLFKYLIGGNKADSIRALKKISEQINQNQNADIERLKSYKNELTQEEYEKRLLEIFDSYSNLRKSQIAVAIDNTSLIKKLEGKLPLLIEDSSAPLPEAT